jgi:molybdenum cofactor guanylyltransferase
LITGIVLAGGASRRFGADKLAAELDGSTLLAAAIASVEAVSDGVVVVGPRLPTGFRGRGVPVALVPDPVPSGGPLVALAHAIGMELDPDPRHSLAVVIGGDMPRVVPGVLSSMLERLRSDSAIDAIILEAPGEDGPQVLPMAVRLAPAARAAAAVLDAGDRSLRGFLARLATAELPAATWRALDPSGESLTDVDRPDDLERLRSVRRRSAKRS